MMNLEALLKRIHEFRNRLEKLKTSENEKYIEFIDITLEWLEDLFRVKRWERIRLETYQWRDIEPLLFPKTIKSLEKELSLDKLFTETSKLLDKIIEIGNIDMTDFDLLQFNLARVFGKNADSIIEFTRQKLRIKLEKLCEKKIKKRGEEARKEKPEIRFGRYNFQKGWNPELGERIIYNLKRLFKVVK